MDFINGKPQEGISLGVSHSKLAVWLEHLLLLGLGAMAITMHARFRMGLNTPGHHGMAFMAIFMAARSKSNLKYAGSLMAIGVSAMVFIPFLGFKDPFIALIYLIPGVFIDLVYFKTKRKFWILCVFSGLAYMMIPFSRLLIHLVSGFPYGAFIKFGYILPHLTHFAFGAIGGIAGLGAMSFRKSK